MTLYTCNRSRLSCTCPNTFLHAACCLRSLRVSRRRDIYKKPSCRQDSRPYCQKLQGSRDLGHAHFHGNYLCACSAFPIQSRIPNSKSLAQVVLEICSIVCQKLQESRDLGHAHFQENYLCARQVFPIESCTPNLKSLAQVVFKILRSKRSGVTSLTFQGHMTSSVT